MAASSADIIIGGEMMGAKKNVRQMHSGRDPLTTSSPDQTVAGAAF